MVELIKEALEKVTQGEWKAYQQYANQWSIEVGKEGFVPVSIARVSNTILEVGTHGNCVEDNAHLIANTPEWLRYLIIKTEVIQKDNDLLEEVVKEHEQTIKELQNALEQTLEIFDIQENYAKVSDHQGYKHYLDEKDFNILISTQKRLKGVSQ